MNSNFAIIGSSGYIAPRHLKAIQEIGGTLLYATDPKEKSENLVNFPSCKFFNEFSNFNNAIKNQKADYITICSPNFLHFEHIKYAIENNINVICEKPLVLNLDDLNALQKIQNNSTAKIYTIFQLRYHDSVLKLTKKVNSANISQQHKIKLHYITPRDESYLKTWKGNQDLSGGILANIGIHFFDMLLWIFGDLKKLHLSHKTPKCIKGTFILAKAEVDWILSIDSADLPQHIKDNQIRTYRSITIDGEELEFSTGFEDLHTLSYKDILAGKGYGVKDAKKSLEIIDKINNYEL